MLYGYNNGLTTIITAATTKEEFKEWVATLEGELYREMRETDFMEHMTNPDFSRLASEAIVVDSNYEFNQNEFNRIHEVVILPSEQAISRNQEMIERTEPDQYDINDERTIEQLFNLDKEDRWDNRDEAEVAADLEMREKIKKMKENDELSGESFSAGKKGGVGIHRVDVSHDADGTIQIDGILAQKYTGTELEDQKEGSSKLAEEVAKHAALEGERKLQRQAAKKVELQNAQARADELAGCKSN